MVSLRAQPTSGSSRLDAALSWPPALHLRGSTGKLYGSGALPSLDGKGRLKIKLTPGRYALVATGSVGGRALGVTIFLTVKR